MAVYPKFLLVLLLPFLLCGVAVAIVIFVVVAVVAVVAVAAVVVGLVLLMLLVLLLLLRPSPVLLTSTVNGITASLI